MCQRALRWSIGWYPPQMSGLSACLSGCMHVCMDACMYQLTTTMETQMVVHFPSLFICTFDISLGSLPSLLSWLEARVEPRARMPPCTRTSSLALCWRREFRKALGCKNQRPRGPSKKCALQTHLGSGRTSPFRPNWECHLGCARSAFPTHSIPKPQKLNKP